MRRASSANLLRDARAEFASAQLGFNLRGFLLNLFLALKSGPGFRQSNARLRLERFPVQTRRGIDRGFTGRGVANGTCRGSKGDARA